MNQIDENYSTETARPNMGSEGRLTKTVESMTSQVPSLTYVGLAMASMALSISIASFTERKWLANFVGHWVPTILLIGVYNKIVKLEGSERNVGNLH